MPWDISAIPCSSSEGTRSHLSTVLGSFIFLQLYIYNVRAVFNGLQIYIINLPFKHGIDNHTSISRINMKHAKHLSTVRIIMKVHSRIMFFCAFMADAVAELCFGMVVNIRLYLVPIPLVITNFFAVHAYGQQPA